MFLGLDLGTTNVKALLADEHGRTVAAGSVAIDCLHTEGGGAEQDIAQIWQATCGAIRAALAGRAAGVRAVGVSSQGGALQLLDESRRPRGKVISWLDGRGGPFDRDITRQLGEDFFGRRLGHGSSGVSVGQILRLRRERPQWLTKPNRIAFVGDCIVGRLCGRGAHDATSLSIAVLYNPWLDRADPELLSRLGIEADQLPDLLAPTAVAGALSQEASAATGLPAGIPVSPAIHDQYAAAVGAGAVSPGDLCLGTGTAWVLLALTERLTPPVTPGAFVCPHLVEGVWGQLLSMCNGGSAIGWTMRLLGKGPPAVPRVDELAASAPAGCDGLRLRPLLTGCPTAGELAGKGGRLSGIALAHSAGHLVRAVIEGLSFELGRHLRILERAGVPVDRLIVSGGAAVSSLTPQILADVTDKPVTCISHDAVSALGASILARAMVEGDLAGLTKRLAPGSRCVVPSGDAPLYHRLLEEYLNAF
jgi:xylulokinase